MTIQAKKARQRRVGKNGKLAGASLAIVECVSNRPVDLHGLSNFFDTVDGREIALNSIDELVRSLLKRGYISQRGTVLSATAKGRRIAR